MIKPAQQFLADELRAASDTKVDEALRLLQMAVNEDVLISESQQGFLQMSLGCLRTKGIFDFAQICDKVESLAAYINSCKVKV